MPPKVQHWEISHAEAGQKLLQYLERRIGRGVPRSALQKWIRTGQVRINGRRTKPFARIQADDIIRIPPFTPQEPHATPTPSASLSTPKANSAITIIAETEDTLVVEKPAGLPVHPGTKQPDSLVGRLRAMRPDADFPPTPAHRLDKNTSGVLLVAKTHTRLRELNEMFRTGGVTKFYLAWTASAWREQGVILLENTVEKRGAPGAERMTALDVADDAGKTARLEALPLIIDGQRTPKSLLLIKLLTGRTHQIRVQLAERGHPILGDGKYGGPPCAQGMLLHAFYLTLGEERYTSPPPWSAPYAPPMAPLQGDWSEVFW